MNFNLAEVHTELELNTGSHSVPLLTVSKAFTRPRKLKAVNRMLVTIVVH